MALPLIPHSELQPDCCGVLCEVIGEQTEFVCNECGAVLSKEEVAPAVLRMEAIELVCPHCGQMNRLSWFSEIYAFTCRYCGHAATMPAKRR